MKRVSQVEVMDDPSLEEGKHVRALGGLARLNAVSGSVGILMAGVREVWREKISLQPKGCTPNITILDLACGAGDVAVGIWRRARAEGMSVEIEGCDFSAVAVREARRRAREYGIICADAGTGLRTAQTRGTRNDHDEHRRDADATGDATSEGTVRFVRRDVLREGLPGGFDIVMCSLFLHHLSGEGGVAVLRKMREAAGRMVLVNDLSRSWTGLALVTVAARVLTRSAVVHADGPRSVRQAFTMEEAAMMGRAAGMAGCAVEGKFPCRWLLTWRKG